MYKLGYISTFTQRNIWQGSALCQRRYTDLWKMACSRGAKCAGKVWGRVDSSVLSFLFTLVATSAEGKQSSVLYRAVACYVLTMPDLSRAHERKVMCYTMAQAFPLPSPLILEFGLNFSWQFRGTGIYGGRYRFGSGLSDTVDPITTTSNSGGGTHHLKKQDINRNHTLWCGSWKFVITNMSNLALSFFHTCNWGLLPSWEAVVQDIRFIFAGLNTYL